MYVFKNKGRIINEDSADTKRNNRAQFKYTVINYGLDLTYTQLYVYFAGFNVF